MFMSAVRHRREYCSNGNQYHQCCVYTHGLFLYYCLVVIGVVLASPSFFRYLSHLRLFYFPFLSFSFSDSPCSSFSVFRLSPLRHNTHIYFFNSFSSTTSCFLFFSSSFFFIIFFFFSMSTYPNSLFSLNLFLYQFLLFLLTSSS